MTRGPGPDMLCEQFTAIVRAELKRQKLTMQDLANRLGVSRQAVSLTLNASATRIKSITVVDYFDALGLDPDLRSKRRPRKPKQEQPPKEGAQP